MTDPADSDTSFSSHESFAGSPIRPNFTCSRLSTSSNSHPSRSVSSSSSKQSSNSSSPSSNASLEPADGEELEKLLGIKSTNPCEVCGKKVVNMKRHIENIHGEGKPGCPVSCWQCDQTVLLSSLGQHVLQFHCEMNRSVSPPPPLSDEESPLQTNNAIKVVPVTCSSSKRPPPQSSSSSSSNSTKLFQSALPEKDNERDDSSMRELDYGTELAIVQASKARMFPRKLLDNDIVVDLNQNNEMTNDSIVNTETAAAEITFKESDIRKFSKNAMSNKKIQFWIETLDRNFDGDKVKRLKIKIDPCQTVRRVKRSYREKFGMGRDNQGDLQFKFDGRKLEDEEYVGQLDNKIILAEGLCFKV
eukprot:GFUD01034623.1.p1 GENE.GFUD01034623.1~~GFUD01034623.1.p1  ORF type:complete len:360 (-),score=110.55 GFUD01034623.1:108-1187(-)